MVHRTCIIKGCEKKHRSRGYCGAHYQRLRAGSANMQRLVNERRSCSVDGCNKPHSSRGFCGMHGERVRRNGSPDKPTGRVAAIRRACSECGHRSYARGMCEPHYRAALKSEKITRVQLAYSVSETCMVRGCETRPSSRGLCQRHYDLKRRRGSEFATPLQVTSRVCSVDSCEDKATARGLCPLHRMRLIRNGDPGEAFDRRIDRICRWCDTLFSRRDARRDYCSAECALFGRGVMNVRQRYGLTFDEYRSLYRRQAGLCAICSRPERSGRNRMLSVDHDHETDIVRGLLCSHCNSAIGMFGDDPDVIEAAARYVREIRSYELTP